MKLGRILAVVGAVALLYWLGLIPALLDLLRQILDRAQGATP